MADLYEKVQKKDRPGRRHTLAVSLAAVFLGLAVTAGLLAWYSGTRPRFYNFVADLSASTSYTYEHNRLRADVPGHDPIRVVPNNAYGLYTYLSVTGPGTEKLVAPSQEPAAVLQYADGAVLTLWANEDGCATIRFVGAEGRQYLYTSTRLFADTIILRYLNRDTNKPWIETT